MLFDPWHTPTKMIQFAFSKPISDFEYLRYKAADPAERERFKRDVREAAASIGEKGSRLLPSVLFGPVLSKHKGLC